MLNVQIEIQIVFNRIIKIKKETLKNVGQKN